MKAVSAVLPVSKSPTLDPAALQTELQRFSDEYLTRTMAALDDYARLGATPQDREQALIWKVSLGSSVISIVSGPNPLANLVDLLTLSTTTHLLLQDHWVRSAKGENFQPWFKVAQDLEARAWRLANGSLTKEQQDQLRNHITQWWQTNGDTRTGLFARPQEFASQVRQSGEKESAGSVFSLVGLDPTASLDPAVREVTRTRLFAERAMYTAQRMPSLLRWHVELLTGELLRQPQVGLALTNTSSLTESADRLSRTAAQLPDRFAAERQAILDALDKHEGRLAELSAEVGRTLAAGEKMSTSLNGTLVTFDALMKRFGVGEPNKEPPSTNSSPFNILDYARTAEQLTRMATELNVVLTHAGTTLDAPVLQQRAQDLAAMADRAKADMKSVLNYAFLLGVGLVLLIFACAVLYRQRQPRPVTTVGRPGEPVGS
jgi:hypothetical protein